MKHFKDEIIKKIQIKTRKKWFMYFLQKVQIQVRIFDSIDRQNNYYNKRGKLHL